jgi:2-dehydropantoate 2-reductase
VFALWAEGVAVADAQDLRLESVHVDPYRFNDAALVEYMKESGNVRPSMLQDLDAGRLTEVDVVNGGVASHGRDFGVPTPCNDRVVELVHSMERGECSPSPRWLAYVNEVQARARLGRRF